MHDDIPEKPGLVAFDFDGTLTTHDSFMAFLKWRAKGSEWPLGMIRLMPAAIAYVFHRKRGVIKAAAVRTFLKGVPRTQLENEAKDFAAYMAPTFLRSDAVAVWRRWRSRKAQMIIVTASPDLLIAPFARGLGADALIGTQLAFDDQDRATGGFAGLNCRGAEKVRRLQAEYGPEVRLTAAYGDTSGDKEMLAIADDKGYRIFKGKGG